MVGKYKVITLCGSTRFKDAFMEAQKKLSLDRVCRGDGETGKLSGRNESEIALEVIPCLSVRGFSDNFDDTDTLW